VRFSVIQGQAKVGLGCATAFLIVGFLVAPFHFSTSLAARSSSREFVILFLSLVVLIASPFTLSLVYLEQGSFGGLT